MVALIKIISFLMVLCFAGSSIALVEIAAAAEISKLPIPKFTVNYADFSYDISAHATTDPFTGEIKENPVEHIENRTLQFTFDSLPVTGSGQLYYVIQMKGHFSENWTQIYKGWVNVSILEDTTWAFWTSGEPGRFYFKGDSFEGPSEGKIDFQVKAQTWGEVMSETSATNPFGGSITTLFGESGWSNTQTVTIPPQNTPTPVSSNQPTVLPTPTDSGVSAPLDWWQTAALAFLAAIVVLLVLVIVLLLRKRTAPP